MGIGELPENEFLLVSNFFENDDFKKTLIKDLFQELVPILWEILFMQQSPNQFSPLFQN